MKKFSKKGVMLFAAAMALCAFAMPSAAGAVSWTPVGTEHTLDSPDVGFTGTSGILGQIISSCTQSSFTADVTSATVVEITHATFGGDCTATFPNLGATARCAVTARATALPWTATLISTSNVQIHGINIDVVFDQTATSTCPALVTGQSLVITGTINSGTTVNNTEHALILNNAEGLTSHSGLLGSNPVTARGTFRDTQQTLIAD
jgi:hypothetical protein